ncbi:MAG: hypothetical protein MHM6MM_005961 [Cercozoa sp. M6MM]
MGFYVGEAEAAALRKYQYKGADNSIMYRLALSPLAAALVEFLPRWVAPNVVTLLGLMCSVSAHVVTLLFVDGEDLSGAMPRWCYVFCALAVFAYQTLDNMDGKQARRTGTSSPLGLLFDHGIDAVNVTVTALTVGACLRVGQGSGMFALWATTLLAFGFATWEEYWVGELNLGVFNGPSEGLLMSVALMLSQAVFGPQFMLTRVITYTAGEEEGALLVKDLVVIAMVVSCAVQLCINVANVLAFLKRTRKQRHTPAALFMLTPFLFMFACGAVIFSGVGGLDQEHTRLVLYSLGLLFCNVACKLMLAHLTASTFRAVRLSMLPHALFLLNLWLDKPLVEPLQLLRAAGFACFVLYAHLVIYGIADITKALGIKCLSIPYKRD